MNQSFDPVVTASGKMLSLITEWLNRVRVRVVVKVRVGSPLGLLFGLGFCRYPHRAYLPTECSANLQSAFYPWPVVVRW